MVGKQNQPVAGPAGASHLSSSLTLSHSTSVLDGTPKRAPVEGAGTGCTKGATMPLAVNSGCSSSPWMMAWLPEMPWKMPASHESRVLQGRTGGGSNGRQQWRLDSRSDHGKHKAAEVASERPHSALIQYPCSRCDRAHGTAHCCFLAKCSQLSLACSPAQHILMLWWTQPTYPDLPGSPHRVLGEIAAASVFPPGGSKPSAAGEHQTPAGPVGCHSMASTPH